MTNKAIAEAFTNKGYEGVEDLHKKELDKMANRYVCYLILSFIGMLIFFSFIVKGIYDRAGQRELTNKFLLEKLSNDCKIKCDSAYTNNAIIINK